MSKVFRHVITGLVSILLDAIILRSRLLALSRGGGEGEGRRERARRGGGSELGSRLLLPRASGSPAPPAWPSAAAAPLAAVASSARLGCCCRYSEEPVPLTGPLPAPPPTCRRPGAAHHSIVQSQRPDLPRSQEREAGRQNGGGHSFTAAPSPRSAEARSGGPWSISQRGS